MPGVRVKPGDLRPSIGFPTKGEMAASRSAKDALRDASRRGQSDGPFSIMSEEGASGVAGRLLGTAQGEWERLLTNRENRTKRDAEAEFLSALKGERDKAQSRYGGMQDRRFEGEPAVAQAGGTTPVNRADAPDTGTTPVDWADAPDTGTTPVDWADAPAADQASRPEASRRAGGRAATKAQDRSRPEANIGEKRPTDELALAETRWGDQIDDEFPDADPETRRELLRLVMGQGGLPREMLMSPAPLVSGRAPGAGPTQIAGK